MELEFGDNRSSICSSSHRPNLGETEGPNVPPDIHKLHLPETEPTSPGRRGCTHRPRDQPQHCSHPLLPHLHVHLLRGFPPRLRSGPSRLPATPLLPAPPPPRPPPRTPASAPCHALRPRRRSPRDGPRRRRRHRWHRQSPVVGPQLQGPRRQPRHR